MWDKITFNIALAVSGFVFGMILSHRIDGQSAKIIALTQQIQQKDAKIASYQHNIKINTDIVNDLSHKLSVNESGYESLKQSLQSSQIELDRTNRINKYFLRIIQSGETGHLSVSKSSSGTNAESETTQFISSTRVAGAIIDNFKTCNDNAIKQNKLIDWVESHLKDE